MVLLLLWRMFSSIHIAIVCLRSVVVNFLIGEVECQVEGRKAEK